MASPALTHSMASLASSHTQKTSGCMFCRENSSKISRSYRRYKISGRPSRCRKPRTPSFSVRESGGNAAIIGSVLSGMYSTFSSRSGVRATDTSIMPSSSNCSKVKVVPSRTSKLTSGCARTNCAMSGKIVGTVVEVIPRRRTRFFPASDTSLLVERAYSNKLQARRYSICPASVSSTPLLVRRSSAVCSSCSNCFS